LLEEDEWLPEDVRCAPALDVLIICVVAIVIYDVMKRGLSVNGVWSVWRFEGGHKEGLMSLRRKENRSEEGRAIDRF